MRHNRGLSFALILAFLPFVAGSGCGSTSPGRSLEHRADRVLDALYERDWPTLADFVHPERGVLLSPSAFVDREEAVVLRRIHLHAGHLSDSTYVWGHEDGTGEVIRATPADFLKNHLLDRDFREARRGARNETIGAGNTINNLPDVFLERRADAGAEAEAEVVFVEYHDPGTEAFGGMDWASLRMVFERVDGSWFLIALVRDQWTI